MTAEAERERARRDAAELEGLMSVPWDAPGYRAACLEAVALAARLDVASFGLDRFLSRLIESGPASEAEARAFLALARLYLRHGFKENARELLVKLLAFDPGWGEAAILAEELGPAGGGAHAPGVAEAALPDLPELPDAPSLPDPGEVAPAAAARRGESALSALGGGALVGVGTRVAGRYLLKERIGKGGNAVVFRALDLALEEEIALKVFLQPVDEEQADKRVRRELKLARQLAHPNIIRVYDIGFTQGCRYISMELLSGEDLRSRLASPLSVAEAVGYLVQACAGLQAAHEQGIIHRDVKPENCFATTEGVLKLMDFGIAKLQAAPGLTTTGIIAGTPAYISPEQIRNFSGVTPATDLYALGVVAYEMLTGSVPFQDDSSMSVLIKHLNEPPPPPRSRNPRLPVELEEAVLRLLEKDPARRFPSARDLGRRLEEILLGLPRR
jgi:serine/threonine-protein kinase